MNLLYIWDAEYNSSKKDTGILLTSKFNIGFDISTRKLTISENVEYMHEFFGKNILDVIAIVGQNGSGKTMLANYIMDALQELDSTYALRSGFLMIFEDEMEKKIKIYVSDKDEELQVDCENYSYEIVTRNYSHEFWKYKVAYFTNALSWNDFKYQKRGNVYDASVGGLMYSSYLEKQNMHYIDGHKNIISNYFETEIEKMINFLYSDIDKLDIPFSVPQYLTITLNDHSVNEKYITKQLAEIIEKSEKLKKAIGTSEISLSKIIDKIFVDYLESWIDRLIKNLILNLFKDVCIPQPSAENKDEQILEFFLVLESFGERVVGTRLNRFERVIPFLDIIAEIVHGSSDYVSKYKAFVKWLCEHRRIFEKNSSRLPWTCTLELNDNNKELIQELLKFYNITNFSFPYFAFDFGLSTGEFNFLNIFANMFQALSTYNHTKRGSIKCTSALLIFDEADLSLHPKWQQKYVDWITRFVSSYANECKMQILIATHMFPLSYICHNSSNHIC